MQFQSLITTPNTWQWSVYVCPYPYRLIELTSGMRCQAVLETGMKILKGIPVFNIRRKKQVSLEHLYIPTKF